jgi:hypothetical protein
MLSVSKTEATIVKHYPVDALYPSPYDWVSCTYLMEKVSKGVWKNIFLENCETVIVSPSAMSFDEYKSAHLALSGEWRGLKERYVAMTQCPLLKNIFEVCDIQAS